MLGRQAEEWDQTDMGKVLAFALAAADVALLVLLSLPRKHDALGDVGLFVGFVALASLAWLVALGTAIVRAMQLRESWLWVVVLVLLLWLPALPELAFGASGAVRAMGRGRGRDRRARAVHA